MIFLNKNKNDIEHVLYTLEEFIKPTSENFNSYILTELCNKNKANSHQYISNLQEHATRFVTIIKKQKYIIF